jgi:regulator of cell morphogenesis and NO signaling
MKSFERRTLAQIVSDKPSAAAVFEKHELDYCCHGQQSLLEACSYDENKYGQVKKELEAVLDQTTPDNLSVAFEKMSLNELIDYILNKHHRYVKQALPQIRLHLQKVENRHGLRHVLLSEILRQFDQLAVELENHMFKEEQILFARIRRIEDMLVHNEDVDHLFNVRMVSDPINIMEKEHDIAGSLMAIIRKLTDNYTVPDDACATYRLTYRELQEFETDLHQHIHLENNILFPRTRMMIDKMMSA